MEVKMPEKGKCSPYPMASSGHLLTVTPKATGGPSHQQHPQDTASEAEPSRPTTIVK